MIYKFKTEQCGIGFDFDINLKPDKKLYCFIGKNGIGKTKLLENMAKTLIFSHSIFQEQDINLHYSNVFMQNGVHHQLKNFHLQLPIDIKVNDINIKNATTHKWGFTTFEHIQGFQNNAFICDKPIVFIGAKNRGFTKNIDTDSIKILPDTMSRFVESFERTLKYINSEGLEHEEIANWFTARLIVNPAFVQEGQNRSSEVITVLKLIEKLEPTQQLVTVREDGGYGLRILFHDGKLYINNVPLEKLSTGFVSIIKIFQEIVAGYGGWTNAEDLSKVDGIVFIDEIEPHLHISWQTKIIQILKEFFPNTTFYISTHSPLVLSGLKDGEAYELNREDGFASAKEIKNIENYFLNDIVKEFFGVDLNLEKIKNPNKERQKKAKTMLLDLANTLEDSES